MAPSNLLLQIQVSNGLVKVFKIGLSLGLCAHPLNRTILELFSKVKIVIQIDIEAGRVLML